MLTKIKNQNVKLIQEIFSDSNGVSYKNLTEIIKIFQFIEKKNIISVVWENIELLSNKDEDIVYKILDSIKIRGPLKKTIYTFMSIIEYGDRIEFMLKNNNKLVYNDSVKNEIIEILKNKINETNSNKMLRDISLEYIRWDWNFFKEICISEIENENLLLIKKIQIRWELNELKKISKEEAFLLLNRIVKNNEILSYDNQIIFTWISCLESIYNKPYKDIITDLVLKEKNESEDKLLNIMIKKIKSQHEKSNKQKIIDDEITIYIYENKRTVFVNFNKIINEKKTIEKILMYSKSFSSGNKLKISIKTKNKLGNFVTKIEEEKDWNIFIEKMEGVLINIDFKKIELIL